jgi:hypothetical protein
MIKTDALVLQLAGLVWNVWWKSASLRVLDVCLPEALPLTFLLGITPEMSLFPAQNIPFSFCFVITWS